MEETAGVCLKRRREDDGAGNDGSEVPVVLEAKRFHEELLLDILDDQIPGEDPGEGDLADVMRSLEEEIGLLPPPLPPSLSRSPSVGDGDGESEVSIFDEVIVSSEGDVGVLKDEEACRQPELGFLLEASDDELGLPPTTIAEEEGVVVVEKPSENWTLDDESGGSCYDAFDLVFDVHGTTNNVSVGVGNDDVVEFPEVVDGLGFPEIVTWLPELYLPAM